jgi:hypothetical protein
MNEEEANVMFDEPDIDCILCFAPIGRDEDYKTVDTDHGSYTLCQECDLD